MTPKWNGLLTPKTGRRLLFSLLTGGVGILFFFATYWISLLLINHHPSFIPNAERRTAMFKFLNQQPPQGGKWIPRQGGHWIF